MPERRCRRRRALWRVEVLVCHERPTRRPPPERSPTASREGCSMFWPEKPMWTPGWRRRCGSPGRFAWILQETSGTDASRAHVCTIGQGFTSSQNQQVENLALCGTMARFLIRRRLGTTVDMHAWESSIGRVSKMFSCATKNPIAGAERAADATVQGSSLGQTLEMHCFRVILGYGARIAAEVEA